MKYCLASLHLYLPQKAALAVAKKGAEDDDCQIGVPGHQDRTRSRPESGQKQARSRPEATQEQSKSRAETGAGMELGKSRTGAELSRAGQGRKREL